MRSFISYLMLLESFSDAQRIWVDQGFDKNHVKQYIEDFKMLKARNQIRNVQEKDIGYWIPKGFYDFQYFVDQSMKHVAIKNEIKIRGNDADKLFENDRYVVIRPKTYEASCKYGANTKWCISMRDTNSHWVQYTSYGIVFYIVIDKLPTGSANDKIAVVVHPKASGQDIYGYDRLDDMVGHKRLVDMMEERGIPFDVFKPIQRNLNEYMDLLVANCPEIKGWTQERFEENKNLIAVQFYAFNRGADIVDIPEDVNSQILKMIDPTQEFFGEDDSGMEYTDVYIFNDKSMIESTVQNDEERSYHDMIFVSVYDYFAKYSDDWYYDKKRRFMGGKYEQQFLDSARYKALAFIKETYQ